MHVRYPAYTFHSRPTYQQVLALVSVILLLLVMVPSEVTAQAFPIFNGTVNTCAGAFLDSGGEGADGYSNNENFTYTICPDSPNDAISLTFLTFNLSGAGNAPADQMTIYDGNSTAANTLGTYAGTALQTVTVQASPMNNTGCLTIVFRSNNAGTGVFAASINCFTPCQRPTAVASMSQADPVRICIGESINFNGSASFAAPGFSVADRTWDFGDGTVLNSAPANVSHTFTQAGEFTTQLYVVDNNNCASSNRVDLVVQVGTEPDFVGTQGELIGCVGQTLCLDGVVNATTWNELPGNDLGGGVFLPDTIGACYESEITYSLFAPGQTLTTVNDLLSICVNMEHSFMGDLVINIISPTGQGVTMHQQGGGGTFLGVPVDNESTPDAQGECWNYCWSPSATNGTWVDNSGGTLPSGTYESLNPLSGLVGSQLNGTWTLQICDLWGLDNGFVCTWDIDFNPALFPDLTEFTPIYGAGADSTRWSGPHISSTSANGDNICVSPPTPGSYDYVYTATDNFGCSYDTTLTVTIAAPPVANAGADAVICGTPVPLNATMVSGGLPGTCTYSLRLIDTVGDGWDGGAEITVTVDGISTTLTLEDPPGNQEDFNIPVQHGDVITLNYLAGTIWNGENRFVLRDAAGTILYNSGTGPASGVAWTGVAVCPPEPFTFTWTPAAGLSNPNIANPTANVAVTTQYCVTASQPSYPNCTATDCMTITVDTGVDPGTNGSITVCENSTAFGLFPLLGGTPTAAGNWTAPGGGAHSGNFTPGADAPGVYTYTVIGSAACGGTPQTSTVTVVVSTLADAGTNGTLTICSTSGAQDLSASLGGTPDAGGTWSGPSPVSGSGFDPVTMNAGIYTYTVLGAAPCPSATATVNVVVNTPPNSIVDGFLTLCSSGAPAAMFDQLGGSPDAGGTWNGPSAVVGGMIDPATMNAGVYTYTVAGTAPCPDESATVTVTINTPPDPGTDGAITLCSSDAAVSLFAQLGGTPDAGGTWSGPSTVVGGLIDPATMNAGVYTYTVSGTAPCPSESATVTVTINSPPDPGTDGTITLCSSDASVSLFAQLGGTPDAGGTWSGPNAVVGGMIDPATMNAGVYTYTVSGTAPCPNESATVTVTINTPPDPGTDGAITLCSSDAAVSLFAQLGGTPDPGGTWSGPSAVAGGMIDPATMDAGVYTYTLAGTAPCPSESATVTVTINTPPDPGTDGVITLCSSDAAVSLFAQLGGTPDPGGTWSGPSAVAGGMIDPATMDAGMYTYTVAGTAPCPDESATVTVTINTPPDPGTDGAIILCSSDAAVSLFAQLGGTPDAGGTWSGPSAVAGGLIDPATMNAGVYTYTVAGTAPCPSETASVTVTINTPPDPGTDGSITLCSSDAAVSLFAQLGGTPDAGGTWIGPSAVAGGMIDPATMIAGVYTYNIAGTAPCPDESATVTVTINTPPDPGTDGAITLCSSDAAVSLFAQLGGSPDAGGTWSGPSAVVSGMIDPATMIAGVYTYNIAGTAPCPDESATVTVTINTPPDPGTDSAITLCSSDAAVSLFAQLGGTPDAGGTWSGPSAVAGGMIDPATMNAGVYTYTVAGTAPCPSESATVTVTINTPPDPGTDGVITLCSSDAAVSLFAQLGGTPDAGGTWSGPSTVVGGMIDPATMNAGVYTYTVAGTAPCADESATVTVTINTPPVPGTDGAITLCSSDVAVSLFAQLGGTPDAGGTWIGPSAVVGGLIDPTTMNAGVYTYTVIGTAPCPSETATVTVSINAPPNPGVDGAIALCATSPPTSLFAELGGSPAAGGTWSGPSALNGTLFDALTMTPGTYTYTVVGLAPCPSASAEVVVNVVTNPDPGTPGSITLCTTASAIDLFDEIGGTPDGGGTWSGPSAITNGLFDPASMNAGVFTYTITVPPPCTSVSTTVTVSLVQPPDAGNDGALTLCISSPSTPLLPSIGGTPDSGGTWSGPSVLVGAAFDPATMTPGTYTYTVPGTTPCPAASSDVVVNVVTTPDAGLPGNITVCASEVAFNLFDELNGTPDVGGAWSGPSAVTGGQFDPATMVLGVYTYTISVPPPCVNVSSTVTVGVVQPPDAGNDGALTLCISSPSTPLLPSIGGTPDAGGTWSGPSVLVGAAFDPATMTPGTYTYTVPGTTPCPAASSDVVVNVVTTPDAGLPGNIIVCASDAAFNLFDELNGTPDVGGAWSGPSAVLGGQFDPATMVPGLYTYTIAVPTPCVNVSSTVTVSVVQPPDAGSDGALTLCISSPATPLLPSIGGTPDTGGAWSGPSVLVGGSFNPATMIAGDFIYTLAGIAPCPAESATVQVDVVDAPNAGTPGVIALCATDDAIDLFAQLGGGPDAGGTWSGPSAISGGSFDPATMLPGVYTYTIAVPPPCTNASSTVTVSVAQPPNAGLDGGLTLCATSGPEAIINGLGGTPDAGGTWSGPSVVSGGNFNPATMTVGAYTYTVAGVAPCPAASALVEVNVVDNPDPGAPGFITLCSTDAAVDMFTWIEGSPDAGGTWSGPSAVSSGLFDPAVNTAGIYTYTLTVPPPCTSASTTVTVDVVLPPDAGLDATATLCITSGSTPLFPVLQGTPDAGGTWTRPNGTAFDGIIVPATDDSGDYTYTVAGTFPCPADIATVTVNIVSDPDPGSDGTLILCASDAPSTLFAALGGTPDVGGTWTDPNGNLFAGTIDPSIQTSGVYTYTIEAPPPCSNVSSTVTVSIIAPPDAGNDGAITLCATSEVIDLFPVLQGAAQSGGTWSYAGGVVDPIFDPGSSSAGVYIYTVTGTTPCPNDVASVTVAITDEPNAGEDAILNLCITGDAVTLFQSLGGADLGGSWLGPDGTSDGIFTPGSSTPGAYIYEIAGTAPCPNASATVTVVQLSDPDAGGDGAVTLCSSNAPIELFNLLQGTSDAGGIWLNSANVPVDATFDPATQASGTLRYILSVPPPCVSDTALVVVEVGTASDAGEDATVASCANGAVIDLFNALNGTPDTGGTWNGPGGSAGGSFQPGTDVAGNYTYTITALAPCPNVSATVTVGIETPPNAGLDGSTNLCPEAPSILLFDLLGGTPDATGTWTGPGGVASDGTFHPATDAPGTYTYTVYGELCPEDAASASVNIYVVPTPNAGPDALSCNLKFDLAASGTWATGTWTLPPAFLIDDATSPTALVSAPSGGSYTFVWNVVTAEGCAASDTVNVLFTEVMEGVPTTSDAICNGSCDGTATVNATGGNGAYMYIWSGGVAGDEAEAIGLCAGMYNVIVADTNGCNVVIPYVIGEPEPLTIDGVVTAPETCPGTCDGTLVVNDAEGVSFTVNGSTQTSPLFNGLCPGAYLVVMTDANGCIAQSAGVVASPPPVIPSFTYSPDTIVVTNAEVNFLNLSSSNAVSFAWTFGEEDESTAENPTYTFPGVLGAIYNVCLTAYDANGCSNTACLPIPIYDVLAVHVPNAFTPNGDGINDEFLPIFNVPQVKDYEFLVFNRWGEQIFGTDLPGKPWDGSYGGVVSQVDVYVWKLICKDAITGELIERIGHVTIVE